MGKKSSVYMCIIMCFIIMCLSPSFSTASVPSPVPCVSSPNNLILTSYSPLLFTLGDENTLGSSCQRLSLLAPQVRIGGSQLPPWPVQRSAFLGLCISCHCSTCTSASKMLRVFDSSSICSIFINFCLKRTSLSIVLVEFWKAEKLCVQSTILIQMSPKQIYL